MWLVEKFQSEGKSSRPAVTRRGDTVELDVDGRTHVLSVETTQQLQEALEGALTANRDYLHTAGTHRRDGSYVVERRGADSSGNRKVFDSFSMLERLAARLPTVVTAEDLSRGGLTAGRRHMVLWHLVEHPELPYELEERQPLTATKEGEREGA